MKPRTIYRQLLLSTVATLAVAASASAQEPPPSGRGHISLIEPFDYPRFHLDFDVGDCPAGTWMTMTPEVASPDKIKSAHSVVLAAFLAKREVRVYAFPGFDGCMVQYIHML